jgi:hypothetical protein
LKDQSVVTLITLSTQQVTSKMAVFFVDAPTPTVGIVGIIYTSDSAISKDAVQQKLIRAKFEILDPILGCKKSSRTSLKIQFFS